MSERITSDRLTPSLLLNAYAAGVFPMAEAADAEDILWVDPEVRGIIPLDDFHASRSLLKLLKKNVFTVTADRDFEAVIDGCADRSTTWINRRIRNLYVALHRMGYAHSVETWRDGELVGGLYGVRLGAAFFGESMFSQADNASKIALCHLIARLRYGGFKLLDAQFVTDHLARFGAEAVSRDRYHQMLRRAIRAPAEFDALDPETPAQDVAQLITQRS